MIQIDWTLAVATGVFLCTLWMLNRLLFVPLQRVLQERQAQTTGALEAASREEEQTGALLEEYELKIKAEKQSGYRRAEEFRSQALRQRQTRIRQARGEAETLLAETRQSMEEELVLARQGLQKEANEIATLISQRFLQGA